MYKAIGVDTKSETANEGQKLGQRSLSAKMRKYVGSIRVNTDDFYTPTFHKPLSLFGRSYRFRYQVLYLRNAIAVPCNKRTDDIWSENQAT